jgi:hypothetical protein
LSTTDEGKANDTIMAELEGYRLPPGGYLHTIWASRDSSWPTSRSPI